MSRIIEKPWGTEEIIHDSNWRVKLIVVKEGHRTSLQKHKEKYEMFFYEDGRTEEIPPGKIHRLCGPIKVLEVARGNDLDIVRLEDDYDR